MLNEQTVFTKALEVKSTAERIAYVRSACGVDDAMRGRIESLLVAHEVQNGLLDHPLMADVAEIASAAENPGTQIDRYTIVEVLGEGGFGIVYKARQEDPIRRLVALKVIKLGMDTEQIVSRFSAERQSLALMDHPNIASVYDAGATDSGRPFFVMELVDGISITDFCDRHRLSVDERLRLFIQVCRAIQHAHEKGIIHRDVKPSNVLVTRKDGVPYPKVIDFGIATAAVETATGGSTTGSWAGTPAYMSPEQIVLGKAHVDLRTDVYGLGVLLYELLTGRTPHVCLESATDVGIGEIRRRIEEDDPHSPSESFRHTSAERITLLATRRQTEGGRLASLCRGDLDCIVMKALRRQPRERYDSVLDFARDLERLMRNEPVAARSAGIFYRCRKFAYRQRRPIISIATMVSLSMLAVLPLGYSWHAQRRQAENRLSEYQLKLEQSIEEADRLHQQALVASSDDLQTITEAIAAAQRAEALLDSSDQHEPSQQRVHGYLATLTKKVSDRRFLMSLERAHIDIVDDEPAERQRTQQALSEAFEALGIDIERSDPLAVARVLNASSEEVKLRAVAAIDIWAAIYCNNTPERRNWLFDVARAADPHPWRLRMRDAVQNLDRAGLESLAEDHELGHQSPSCFIVLIYALQQTKSRHFMTVLHRGTDAYPNVLFFNTVLGNFYSQRASRFDGDAAQKAIRYLSAALALRPTEPRILNNLGMNLSRVGDHEQAIRVLRNATLSHPDFWYSWHNLGLSAMRCREFDTAAEAFGESLKLLPTIANRQPMERLLKRTLVLLRDARTIGECDSIFDDSLWSYSTTAPEHWPIESVDAHPANVRTGTWRPGSAPFGSTYFTPQTPWTDAEIWLHRRFLTPPDDGERHKDLVVVIRAVAYVEVYLDGIRVVNASFTRDEPRCFPVELQQDDLDRHTITVHAKATGPERCVQIDLIQSDLQSIDKQCNRQRQDTVQWLLDNHERTDPNLQTLVNLLRAAGE